MGLGNELMGDDGAGLAVARRLRAAVSPAPRPAPRSGLRPEAHPALCPEPRPQPCPTPESDNGASQELAPGGPQLRVEEAHTDVLALATLWQGEPQVWLVDALCSGTPAGSIHLLEHEQVLSMPQRHATAHHLSLPECLRWLALADPRLGQVRYRLWGIAVERASLRPHLSAPVARAVEEVTRRILIPQATVSCQKDPVSS